MGALHILLWKHGKRSTIISFIKESTSLSK